MSSGRQGLSWRSHVQNQQLRDGAVLGMQSSPQGGMHALVLIFFVTKQRENASCPRTNRTASVSVIRKVDLTHPGSLPPDRDL